MLPAVEVIVRWAGRVTAVLIAATFMVFVAGEPPGSLMGIQTREWVGMALLFCAIVAMLVGLKWQFPAALISLFALAAFAAVVHMQRYDVLVIAAIPNFLFLIDWKLRHHSTPTPKTK